jgi:hypothetical protein
MKKSAVLFVAAFSTLLVIQTAKADVIADWTFQTSASTNNIIGAGLITGPTQSGVLADIGTGTASASHATAATAWSSPSGNGSSNSWSANNWTLGDYYQFSASSAGFQNITISYDQVGSATGPGHFDFEYSTDGSTFTPVGSVYNLVSAPSWNPNTASGAATESFSYDLSLITALNNVSAVYFRIVDQSATTAGAINGGNVGTGGTGRVDNFIVNATLVPEPSTIALAALGGLACLFGLRRKC